MTTPGISPAQLKRCRKLVITNIGSVGDYRYRLDVTDPRINDRVVTTLTARTRQDLARMRRALITKYRVPQENVTMITAMEEDEDTVNITLPAKIEPPKRKRGRPPKQKLGGDHDDDRTDKGPLSVS